MKNFIIVNNHHDDPIIININQIIDIMPDESTAYIELSNGRQITAKITFDELVEMINKAQ